MAQAPISTLNIIAWLIPRFKNYLVKVKGKMKKIKKIIRRNRDLLENGGTS
jgi:hypothetical protein